MKIMRHFVFCFDVSLLSGQRRVWTVQKPVIPTVFLMCCETEEHFSNNFQSTNLRMKTKTNEHQSTFVVFCFRSLFVNGKGDAWCRYIVSRASNGSAIDTDFNQWVEYDTLIFAFERKNTRDAEVILIENCVPHAANECLESKRLDQAMVR